MYFESTHPLPLPSAPALLTPCTCDLVAHGSLLPAHGTSTRLAVATIISFQCKSPHVPLRLEKKNLKWFLTTLQIKPMHDHLPLPGPQGSFCVSLFLRPALQPRWHASSSLDTPRLPRGPALVGLLCPAPGTGVAGPLLPRNSHSAGFAEPPYHCLQGPSQGSQMKSTLLVCCTALPTPSWHFIPLCNYISISVICCLLA